MSWNQPYVSRLQSVILGVILLKRLLPLQKYFSSRIPTMGSPTSRGLLEHMLVPLGHILHLLVGIPLPLLVGTPLPLPLVMAPHLPLDMWAGHLPDIQVGLPQVLAPMEPQDPHLEWTLNSSLGSKYVIKNYGRKRTLFHCKWVNWVSYISRMNHSRFSVSLYE